MRIWHWFNRVFVVALLGAVSACPPASPETAEQVRDKLLTVDGDGSGLDADLLDGMSTADLQRRITGICAQGTYATAVGSDGTLSCSSLVGPAARQIVVVPAAGTAAQNGAAFRSALAGVVLDTAKTWVIALDAGDYDVGTQPIVLGRTTHLTGAGVGVTRILGQGSGANPKGVISVTSSGGYFFQPEIRSLTIRCTGNVTCSALELSNAGPSLRSVSLEAELMDGSAYGVHGAQIAGTWRDVTVTASSEGSGVTVAGMWVGLFQPDVLDLQVGANSGTAATIVGMHLEAGSSPHLRQANVAALGPAGIGLRVADGYPRLFDSKVYASNGTAVEVASGKSAWFINTQIDGPRVGPGTLKCLSSYDGSYDPLGTGC